MDVFEAIKTRRSVRKFTKKQVEEEKIKELINAGRLAPSGKNLQPVEYVIVTDPSRRETLSKIATYGKFIKDAPVCIVVFSRYCNNDLMDGAAATENILLAAHGMELAGCWVAGYNKEYADDVKEFLNVPDDYRLISLLPIGYPDDMPDQPEKKSIEDVIHREEF